MAVEFGDGVEPWSVGRGGVKRWLHCQIRDIDALDEERQVELAEWLEAREVVSGTALLVTRDQAGQHRLHVAGRELEVELADLPAWLQRAEPGPATPPAAAVKPARGRRGSAAAG